MTARPPAPGGSPPADAAAPVPSVRWIPRVCVWELTLACNSRCAHCGSRAGDPRARELDTAEALRVVEQLAGLGCESVTFSGGEPLMRRDWPTLGRAVRAAGMGLELITNGLLVKTQADAIAEAGFSAVTFSVDGPAEAHDVLRGVPGGLDRLLEGVEALRHRGVRVGAATQVNRRNLARLADIRTLLVESGIQGWQIQVTMPHGRAGEPGAELCLSPADLPRLEAQLVALITEGGLFTQASDNIGYMSRHEPLLRAGTGQPPRVFTGCGAGLQVVGITSDGTVRGCLSLPPAADEGNLRERSLVDIWHAPEAFAYNRCFQVTELQGPCASCHFARVCRGGCRSLAWATSGHPFANAHCLHHVSDQALAATERA